MRILSIDGGGVRGFYSAYLLNKIQQRLHVDYTKEFDLIVGSSAGSLVAAAIALGLPSEKIIQLFNEKCKEFFNPVYFSLKGFLREKYDPSSLRKLLEDIYGDSRITDSKTKLMITATDIVNSKTHLFKSFYSKQWLRDKDLSIVDAVMASCSVPLYFRPTYVDPYLLADGGLWATNPCLVAIAEAVHCGVNLKDIKLLSIGTGISQKRYSLEQRDSMWGLVTVWGIEKFAEMVFNLQIIAADNIAKRLLKEKQIVRINFETEKEMPMDQLNIISDLKTRADADFTRSVDRICEVFGFDPNCDATGQKRKL